jgi:hypothetical protein
MIAFCGLDCAQCEAYQATQANDEAAKERIAAQWREQYNAPGITVESITCDGCLAFDGRLGGHCAECDVRQCGIEHAVSNCAGCAEYSCEKLEAFLQFAGPARENLEALRRAA